MKTRHALLLSGGFILLSATIASAQQNLATNVAVNSAINAANSLATNIASSVPTNAPPPEGVTEYGQPLLSEELKDRLRLSSLQRAELKVIEDDFDETRFEYHTANQARIEAAYEANRQARLAKDDARILASREQFELVWASMKPEREAALVKVKRVLTPEQLKFFGEIEKAAK